MITENTARSGGTSSETSPSLSYALCDWLLGSDAQWLYALDEDNAYTATTMATEGRRREPGLAASVVVIGAVSERPRLQHGVDRA
jgi:hypothetical protein